MIGDPVRFVDERLNAASLLRKALRYVFPDHWSFMLGEIALYAFVVLVGTGIFLAFHYVPSDAETVYRGTYEPLQGATMSQAYKSVLDLSLDVPAGLLIRQTHHWAANVFIAAIALHLVRILFTGAFRKPRELNYWIGLTMLAVAIFEGFLGYSLIDDLLSGMGLAIAYAVAIATPVIGASASLLIWDGEYPGATVFWDRMFTMHILILPLLLAALISLHMFIVTKQHHTQFPGPRRTERNVVGTPMWPGYALRSLGLLCATSGVLLLLGGLVQINPIWLWGPYETYLSTNAAQPDWYLGWLIGGLRIMPPFEPAIGDYTLAGNAFWAGALFPMVAFAILYLWPLIDRRWSGKGERHELLDRPRDNPRRSAALVGFFTWVSIPFAAGATDRVFYRLGIPYEAQIWIFRVLVIVGPVLAWLVARRIFEELHDRDDHPLRGWTGRVVQRNEAGGFTTLAASDGRARDGGGGEAADEPAAPADRRMNQAGRRVLDTSHSSPASAASTVERRPPGAATSTSARPPLTRTPTTRACSNAVLSAASSSPPGASPMTRSQPARTSSASRNDRRAGTASRAWTSTPRPSAHRDSSVETALRAWSSSPACAPVAQPAMPAHSAAHAARRSGAPIAARVPGARRAQPAADGRRRDRRVAAGAISAPGSTRQGRRGGRVAAGAVSAPGSTRQWHRGCRVAAGAVYAPVAT